MRESAGAPPETALGILVRLTEHLNQSGDLSEMLSGTLDIVCGMLAEQTGWITIGEEHEDPKVIVGRRLPPALDAQGQSALRWGPCRCQRHPARTDVAGLSFYPCERLEMASGDNGGLLYHLSVPIRVGRRGIGLLNVASDVERPLSYEEQAALTAGVQAVGLAVERLSRGQPGRRPEVGQQAMLDLSSQLLGSLDPDEIMGIAARVIAETLEVPVVSVRLLDEAGQALVLRAGIGWPAEQVGTQRVELADPTDIDAACAREQRTIVLGEGGAQRADYALHRSLSRLGLRSAAYTAMVVGGRAIGTIGAASHDAARFGPEERRFLALAADQAALALDRGDLLVATRRQLRDLALLHDHAAEQTRQLSETYGVTLAVLGDALELRDQDTMGHTERVVALSESIGRGLGLSEEELVHLRWGAYVHDLGKIGVPDAVLRKPGPLTPEEWTLMQRHPEQGYHLLERLFFLSDALDVVRYHHERFDGKGYPLGLKGDEIPLLARIFAVADAYDAMTNDRPYRRSMSAKMALAEIQRHSGAQFDPRVVDALVRLPRKGRHVGPSAAQQASSEAIRTLGLPLFEGQNLLDFARTASFLLGTADLQAALQQVLAQVHTLFGYPTCSVLLLNRETGMLHFHAHRGYDPDILQQMHLRIDRRGIVGHVMETGETYYAPDVHVDSHYVEASARVRSEVAIPIRVDGETIGVLDVESPDLDAFPSAARTVLEAFSVLASLAVQRHRQEEALSRAARTDSVTGLGNRRALESALEREHARAARHGRPLALVKLNVDGYAEFLRQGRHRADEVLRAVGRLLGETCRKEDHIVRVDAGEFAMILPETAKMGALLVAERIRADASRMELRAGQRLTVSLGVSAYPEDAPTAGALRDSADHAMHRAMRRGGGEVAAHTRRTPPAPPGGPAPPVGS